MSIYIHGIDMPTKENTVILITPQGDVWMIGDMPNEDTHLAKAKAVPVPPHGRLIDVDALHKLFEDQWHYLQVLDWNENPTAEAKQGGINWCINTMHDDAPTIIPAEEGNDG